MADSMSLVLVQEAVGLGSCGMCHIPSALVSSTNNAPALGVCQAGH